MSIKAGYRITVESWENDADNYRTLSVDGIQDKEYVHFLVDVLQLHEDGCNNKLKFGNMYDPGEARLEKYKEALTEICTEYNAIRFFSGTEYVQGFSAVEYLKEELYEFYGSSEFYTRVTDSIIVEFIPAAIEIEDVTDEFVL